MKGHWKVPFRAVYCQSFWGMVKQTIWCHGVLKLFPHAHNLVPCQEHHFQKQSVCSFCGCSEDWLHLTKAA